MRIIMIDRKEDYLPKGRLIEELKAAYDEKSRGSVRNIFIISFTFSDKCGNITLAISYCFTLDYAPVAQGIEHRPPEAGAAVRIRPGVYFISIFSCADGGSLMEGRDKDCSKSQGKYRKIAILAVLIISVAVVGAASSSLTKAKVQKAQKKTSEQLYTENLKSGFAELNPLKMDEYPEITGAVRDYYKQQGEEAGFVESYDDICVYTKEGKYRGTYVVFARYNMKIREVYTKVPGLSTLYVVKDEEGGYQVSASVEDEKVKSNIQKIAAHEDVQALMSETQDAYQTAVRSDALLKEALADLENAYNNVDA